MNVDGIEAIAAGLERELGELVGGWPGNAKRLLVGPEEIGRSASRVASNPPGGGLGRDRDGGAIGATNCLSYDSPKKVGTFTDPFPGKGLR